MSSAICTASITVVALMCGLPASGKSRLAQRLLSACKEENWDVAHIEYDQVEDSLLSAAAAEDSNHDNNEYTRDVWKASRTKSLQVLEAKLQEPPPANTNNALPRIIILDDNFHLRSMRREVFRTCQEFVGSSSPEKLVYFVILWLDVPKDLCLQRNIQRERSVQPDIIDRMTTTLEPPGKEHWEQCFLHIQEDTENSTIIDFVTRKCLRQPVAPPPPPVDLEQLDEERRKTRQSWLHTWDQRLRSWVGTVTQISRKDTGQANRARKSMLQKLRQEQQGDNLLPNESIIFQMFLDEMNMSWTGEQLQMLQSAVLETS
jgi:tRNA uridine 5-carbamoylmethylation protein Kti12